MKGLSVLCLLVVILVLAEAAKICKNKRYTTKYDDVNLDEILNSDRLLHNYINCLLNTGRCTPDAADLRKRLPDALHTECSKCSEKQKEGAEKVIKHLIDHNPQQWKLLEERYDKEGVYRKKYEEQEKKLRSKQ